jgi:hypothetical protein
MGTIIAFPADAAARRQSSTTDGAPREGKKAKGKSTKDKNINLATVLILPVVRIERNTDNSSGGSGPEEGTAPGRRRRRRT